MKLTLTFSDFVDLMKSENFTYDELQAIFERIEEYEDEIGEEIEFDRVAIRTAFNSYENVIEAANDILSEKFNDPEEAQEALEDQGYHVIELSDSVIISEI